MQYVLKFRDDLIMKVKKRHIFYLEDEEIILDQWAMILQERNFRVSKSKDAKEAFEAINQFVTRKEIIDYFLLDIIIIPWEPLTDGNTLSGFITGLRIAEHIMDVYTSVNQNYKIIFVTAALSVPGQVSRMVDEFHEKHIERCELLRKPIKLYDMLKALS